MDPEVAVHHAEFVLGREFAQRLDGAAIAARVVVDDGDRVPVLEEPEGGVRADEPGAAGDEDVPRERRAVRAASDSWTSSSWRIEAYDDPAPEPEPRYRTAAKMSATKPTRSMGIRPEEETIASAEEVTRRGPEDRRAGFGYDRRAARSSGPSFRSRVSQTGPRLVGARRVAVKG